MENKVSSQEFGASCLFIHFLYLNCVFINTLQRLIKLWSEAFRSFVLASFSATYPLFRFTCVWPIALLCSSYAYLYAHGKQLSDAEEHYTYFKVLLSAQNI